MAPPRKRAVSLTPSGVSASGDVRIVRMSVPCGWCITFDCNNCLVELLFEKKLYLCGCKSVKCLDKHVPSMGVEATPEPEVPTAIGDEEDV
jgi:hypothetical protein